MKDRAVAVLTVRGAAKMSPEQRRVLAQWLRSQAEFLQIRGSEYSNVFRARYLR